MRVSMPMVEFLGFLVSSGGAGFLAGLLLRRRARR